MQKHKGLSLKVVVTGAAILVATSAVSGSNALAAAGKEARGEKAEGRIEAERKAAEGEKVRKAEVAESLKISPKELTDFLNEEIRSGRATPENRAVWKELFRRIDVKSKRSATAADYENADLLAETVGSYIALKKTVADDFHIRETDLLDINTNWTQTQKSNFAKALRRASQIARKSKRIATSEQAFEAALKEMGILDKYLEGCRF